jgi:hypothetical protein
MPKYRKHLLTTTPLAQIAAASSVVAIAKTRDIAELK